MYKEDFLPSSSDPTDPWSTDRRLPEASIVFIANQIEQRLIGLTFAAMIYARDSFERVGTRVARRVGIGRESRYDLSIFFDVPRLGGHVIRDQQIGQRHQRQTQPG